MNGDQKLFIQFEPVEMKESVDNLDQKVMIPVKKPEFNPIELIHPPLPTEEPKVAPQIEEDEFDKLTKVKFIEDKIIHNHSGNTKTHTHYPTYNNIMLGSNCHICNYPVYGTQYCPNCEMIFFEE